MAHIPQVILDASPVIHGMNLRGRGKVRDSYDLIDDPDKMFVVASDRCSIFDFVLATTIDQKGEILTAMNHFWTKTVLEPTFKTDFIAAGAKIDHYLQGSSRMNRDLQKRGTIVNKYFSPDEEEIVRFILTGSGWESYQKDRTVCGHQLPPGLKNGDMLPCPLYTPSTKATVGHDEHLDASGVVKRYGYGHAALVLYVAATAKAYAEKRGILLGDTKLEMCGDIFIDEKFTPDSSRFFDIKAWSKAVLAGKQLPSLDKQFLRDIGKLLFVDKDPTGRKRQPENPEDLAYVDSLAWPDDVREKTTRLYRYIFWRLTGLKIEAYQRQKMGIDVGDKALHIEILIGSESDRNQADTCALLKHLNGPVTYNMSVMSCHRNPEELREFARTTTANVIIAGAGMAAALPGIVKSWLCRFGKSHIPVIGVAFRGKNIRETQAAISSIEDLPGQPVELNQDGRAYSEDNGGFGNALVAAIEHEFLPKEIEAKPVNMGFMKSS